MENKQLIHDLVNENRVFFAKVFQIKKLRKEEVTKLFEEISNVASSVYDDPATYLKKCSVLFNVLFSVVKLTRQEKDTLNDIKNNLREIEELRNETKQKTNA